MKLFSSSGGVLISDFCANSQFLPDDLGWAIFLLAVVTPTKKKDDHRRLSIIFQVFVFTALFLGLILPLSPPGPRPPPELGAAATGDGTCRPVRPRPGVHGNEGRGRGALLEPPSIRGGGLGGHLLQLFLTTTSEKKRTMGRGR